MSFLAMNIVKKMFALDKNISIPLSQKNKEDKKTTTNTSNDFALLPVSAIKLFKDISIIKQLCFKCVQEGMPLAAYEHRDAHEARPAPNSDFIFILLILSLFMLPRGSVDNYAIFSFKNRVV